MTEERNGEVREQKRICYGRIIHYSRFTQVTTNCYIPITVGCINSSILHIARQKSHLSSVRFITKLFLKEKNLSEYLSFKFDSEIVRCPICISTSTYKEFFCNASMAYYMSFTHFITRVLHQKQRINEK